MCEDWRTPTQSDKRGGDGTGPGEGRAGSTGPEELGEGDGPYQVSVLPPEVLRRSVRVRDKAREGDRGDTPRRSKTLSPGRGRPFRLPVSVPVTDVRATRRSYRVWEKKQTFEGLPSLTRNKWGLEGRVSDRVRPLTNNVT